MNLILTAEPEKGRSYPQAAERRSGVERRRTGDRRHSRVAYVTAWQLPER